MMVDVRLVQKAEHSPAQLAAWRQLWVLLLAERPQNTKAGSATLPALPVCTAATPPELGHDTLVRKELL
jgi:hypothetical protein